MNTLPVLMVLNEYGLTPRQFSMMQAQNQVWSDQGGPLGRQLFKAAADLLQVTGRGHTAPAYHLRLWAKSSEWSPQMQDLANSIGGLIHDQTLVKRAMSVQDAVGLGGLAGRGALMGSMALGGGLGALYWLLARHANQDEADVESTQQQVDYYHDLSRNLEDSMRRRYRYDRATSEAA